MRYLVHFLCLLCLTGCVTVAKYHEQSNIESQNELIMAAFTTPDGNLYLLGKQGDYQVARKQIAEMKTFVSLAMQYPYDSLDICPEEGKLSWHTQVIVPITEQTKFPSTSKIRTICVNEKNREIYCGKAGAIPSKSEWFERWELQPVTVSNREQILQTAKLAKPISTTLQVTKPATTAQKIAGKAGAAATNMVANTVLAVGVVVAAPIYYPLKWLSSTKE